MDRKKNIKLADIEPNKGQIEGLPQNPRFIKDNRFKQLVKSIEDAPEMLDPRPLIVFPHEKKYVIIAGNMRFRACKELGYKELPCYVLPEETPAEKLREYAIKDNIGFGADDWDILMNEWDTDELKDWGMELPNDIAEINNPYTTKTDIPQYDIQGENPLLTDLYDREKSDELIYEIDRSNVSDGEKEFLKEAAKRHTVFNYKKIAEYYACATEEMQGLMEKSALVIIDIDNAIANGYVELSKNLEKLLQK